MSILLQKLLHALRMTFKAPLPTTLPSPRGCKNLEKMASLPLYAYKSKGCGKRIHRQETIIMQVAWGVDSRQVVPMGGEDRGQGDPVLKID